MSISSSIKVEPRYTNSGKTVTWEIIEYTSNGRRAALATHGSETRARHDASVLAFEREISSSAKRVRTRK